MSEPGFEEGDCPLCLEPLPPFWDATGRLMAICCGKQMCRDCTDERRAYLNRADAEGTFGRQERQLGSFCPLCRTEIPSPGTRAKCLLDRFEKGELPLNMYCMLGMDFINGIEGVELNVERGVEILKLAAEKGDPECQYLIGNRYEKGNGLPKSTAEATRWWFAAAKQGHAIAEFNLALTFGEEGDDAEYVRYLRGSASKGYDDACYNLGLDYYRGQCGLEQSCNEAIRVLTPAAERGDAASMGVLGSIMCCPESNLMTPGNPNFTKGIHWLRRAAEKGDQNAISALKGLEEDASSICFKCNKKAPPETTFLRCSRCRAAWYCSKDCQVQHWRAEEGGHRQRCIKWE